MKTSVVLLCETITTTTSKINFLVYSGLDFCQESLRLRRNCHLQIGVLMGSPTTVLAISTRLIY
jgi:hypothetical protein